MRKLSYLTTLIAMFFIASCSGDGGFVGDNTGGNTPGGGVDVSAVNVLTSSPSLPSDAGQQLDITVVTVSRCRRKAGVKSYPLRV